MASYNGDFGKMQEEALARLREMQKRSRTAINRPGAQPKPMPPQPPQNRENRGADQAASPIANQPQRPDILKNLFGEITADPEKVLILLMLFVLYKNKADIKLLLALGYLLV